MSDEPVVTTTMFTGPEKAAWEVAVDRGLSIEAADLRALLDAAGVPRLVAAVEAVQALTRDTDGHDLPGESEFPVGEFQAAIVNALLPAGAA